MDNNAVEGDLMIAGFERACGLVNYAGSYGAHCAFQIVLGDTNGCIAGMASHRPFGWQGVYLGPAGGAEATGVLWRKTIFQLPDCFRRMADSSHFLSVVTEPLVMVPLLT